MIWRFTVLRSATFLPTSCLRRSNSLHDKYSSVPTESHRGALREAKSLLRLRKELFRYRLVMLARIAFQACSFNHSDILSALESVTYGRSMTVANCARPPKVPRSLTGASQYSRRSSEKTMMECAAYGNRAYSARAFSTTGILESASFHSAKTSS